MASQPVWQDMAPPLGMRLDPAFAIDPYLIWALITDFVSFDLRAGPPTMIPFIIEIEIELEGAAVPAEVAEFIGRSSDSDAQRTIFTIRIPPAAISNLVELTQANVIKRYQLGVVRDSNDAIVAPQTLKLGLLSHNKLQTLGVIDDGFCIANDAFRTIDSALAVGSRIHFLWDQDPSAPAVTPWARYTLSSPAPSISYGVEIDRGTIASLLTRFGIGETSERAFYQCLDRPCWGLPDHTHGGRVLQLFAGRMQTPGLPAKARLASELGIICVQLPSRAFSDTTGGSLGPYIIDGARYIVDRTRALAHGNGADWETTINISLGSMAGPHDGTSMTEKALSDLVSADSTKTVRIVVAAGNGGGMKSHARRLLAAGGDAEFHILAPPANLRESHVEFWFPASADPSAGITVSVTSPEGLSSPSIGAGELRVLKGPAGIEAALIFAPKVSLGENGTMVLLAIRATTKRPTDPSATTPGGFWTINFTSARGSDTEIHAWVGRNDTIIGARRRQQTHFVCEPGLATGEDDSTLNSIANGRQLVAAGAYTFSTRFVTRYSGRGPVIGSAATKPDYYGPSERSPSKRGVRIPGFFTGWTTAMTGTSASAPRVARWLSEGSPAAELITMRDPPGAEAVVMDSTHPDLPEEQPTRW